MFKKAIKYQMFEMKKAIITYYGIMLAMYMIPIIFLSVGTSGGRVSGMETTTVVFLFIIGLNSLKETFGMFLQNGLSRKTLFYSYTIKTMIVSMIMALISNISGTLGEAFYNFDSLFMQIYRGRYLTEISPLVRFIDTFLWMTFLYMVAAMLGYFIIILYYRMNDKLKIIVSVGVPTFFIIGIPLIEYNWTNGAISRGIFSFVAYTSGYTNGYNPYYFMATSAVVLVVLGGLSYLLLKKAIVKTS
ncbi:MAG TPA: hypothetical protein GX707_04910 [Epulopiscium sp.]|nr:hypothetical protein [Candidatus Epulonipiscium sp.]